MYNDYCQTPIGAIEIHATERGISRLSFISESTTDVHSCGLIKHCIDQINDYFAHKLFKFTLPLDPTGTVFQQSVWEQLASIPYGATSSYGDIAKKLGKPNAMRAVGGANNKNPIAILLPCHRVIGSNGGLVGYTWGVERKKWLLEHESS